MKKLMMFSVLVFSNLTYAEPGVTRARATINFFSGLIYEEMTDAPVWTDRFENPNSDSSRNSFIKKIDGLTCTASKYDQPQYESFQNNYSCSINSAWMNSYGLNISGTAAKIALRALAKRLKSEPVVVGSEVNINIPNLGIGVIRNVGNRDCTTRGIGCFDEIEVSLKGTDLFNGRLNLLRKNKGKYLDWWRVLCA